MLNDVFVVIKITPNVHPSGGDFTTVDRVFTSEVSAYAYVTGKHLSRRDTYDSYYEIESIACED